MGSKIFKEKLSKIIGISRLFTAFGFVKVTNTEASGEVTKKLCLDSADLDIIQEGCTKLFLTIEKAKFSYLKKFGV
jgi:hypothetical protein